MGYFQSQWFLYGSKISHHRIPQIYDNILLVFNKRWRLGDVRLQPVCVPVYLHDANLGVSFSISPLWWSVILGESHQLQHVESILSALDILQNILYAASFSGKRGKRTTSWNRINKYALFAQCRVEATVQVKITKINSTFFFHKWWYILQN